MNVDLQLKLAKETPYFKHLGIEVVGISEGFAKLAIDFKDHLTHPFGYFHGGAIASLADSAGVNSVLSILSDEEKALTLEMKINYFMPVKNVKVYAEGRVIHKGKRFAVSDVDVKTVDGQMVAKAIVTCAIL
ncbi:MAG: PaaI family thioesterase [Proteobacteria bacterium]|nr:PaaI family thioesterase [Pseudomonadota bacterium]